MLKRILSVIALVLVFAVLSGTALADYGYTSVDSIPMARPFTVRVAFDENGLPQVITDYPFEQAGADEMNLVYSDGSNEVFSLNYRFSTGKTTVGSWDSDVFAREPGEEAYRMIRNGEVTLNDEITINSAHFNQAKDWFLVYSASQENYIQYSEATNAQSFNGTGEGGVRKSLTYYDGELESAWMVKRGRDADLMIEYNAYGEIEYAVIQQYKGGETLIYDYDPYTRLFSGHPITDLGFEESDLAIEALAARNTRTETVVRDYETQIVADAKDMAKTTIRMSGGLVSGIIMGIVLYYMIRRGRQNAKEKAARKKENAEKPAEKADEAPEFIEPPQMMSSSNR